MNLKYVAEYTNADGHLIIIVKDEEWLKKDEFDAIRSILDIQNGVISDLGIELSYKSQEKKETIKVKARLICFIDPVSGKRLAFLTNMIITDALTVSLLYQNRSSIEVLFKQLKQDFELTYFLSDRENDIKIQIWVALILNQLFEVIHRQIQEAEDFATLVKIAAKNLCSYVSLVKF